MDARPMSHFYRVSEALQAIDRNALAPIISLLDFTRIAGGIVWLAGNGGSHAVALHWATDFVKVLALRAAVLGANGPLLTAYANDEHYADTLANEFERQSRLNDCLICLSCSGTSPNVLNALSTARMLHRPSVLFTSQLCPDGSAADHLIIVPSDNYGVIEDCFAAIGHYFVEEMRA